MGLPIGSSVYFIFALINCLTLSPVSGSENSNDSRTMRESERQDTTANLTEAIEPSFFVAVRCICCDRALRIRKCELRLGETDAVLLLIDDVLSRVPIEASLRHG